MFDVIIIGAGMAGLYTAYSILERAPHTKLIILERESYIGGRAGTDTYYDVPIVTGAGIGRLQKDHLLIDLMTRLKLPIQEFNVTHQYGCGVEVIDPVHVFFQLRDNYKNKPPQHRVTFKEYAISVIGKKGYDQFKIFAGFTDYEDEDAYDTLFYYGFEDNIMEWKGFSVPWAELVKRMVSSIGRQRIRVDCPVTKITRRSTTFIVQLNDTQIRSRKVVLATTINTVTKLVHVHTKLYKGIKGQPFLRVYGKFTPSSEEIMKKLVSRTTIVDSILQKILPIGKGVYMISYSDNKNAIELLPHCKNNYEQRQFFCRLLEQSLCLPRRTLELVSIRSYFWSIGTHYYTPNPTGLTRLSMVHRLQRPLPGMFVVGEMISMNQGWVEGALESVNKVMNEIIKEVTSEVI